MLTAGLLAACLVATASAAGPSSPTIYALHWDSGSHVDLLRLDAETLAVTGRISLPGRELSSPVPRAVSPNGTRLALGGFPVISMFDTQTMREAGTADFYSLGLAWPSSRRLSALGARNGSPLEFATIDPDSAAVVAEWPLPDSLVTMRAYSGGIAALTTPVVRDGRQSFFYGAPISVSVFGRSGAPRLAHAPLVRLAVENWHATPSSPLPPRATQALALARDDLARRRGIPPAEVEAVAVRPGWVNLFDLRGRAYDIVLGARGEYVSYVATIDPGIRLGDPTSLPGRPAPSENDILRVEPGTWEIIDARLVADARRGHVYLVTSGSVLVDVNATSGRIRYRPLQQSLGDLFLPSADPVLAGRKVFAATGGVWTNPGQRRFVIVDLNSGRVVDRSNLGYDLYEGRLEPSGSRVFVYSPVRGVSLLGPSGRARYTILEDSPVGQLHARGSRAYVTLGASVAVVDVPSGRILRTVTFSDPIELLVGRQPPPF